MLMTLYKGLTSVSTPFLEAYLKLRTKNGKEDPVRAGERRGKALRPRGARPLVWCHAASVGESLALLSLITRLVKDYPMIQIMVTTGTVTSAKLMEGRLPAGAFHQFFPVDHPRWAESFLGHWQPNFVIWSESEFWPNMLAGIRKRGIPAVLLNARMSDKSFQCWQMAPDTIREILSTFSLCLGQNEKETEQLKKLGAAAAEISGNLKYAAAPLPADEEKLAALRKMLGGRPHILWASTHDGEEKIACRIHAELRKLYPALLTIIVPRHPERGGEIVELADELELESCLRSQDQKARKDDDIYIADTLGELGLFYRLSPLCVMGGSFVPVGGHNPIEPAQLGCQIFYGPHMFNFTSICADFESRAAAKRVTGEAELVKALELALREPDYFAGLGTAAKEWTEQQGHIIDDLITKLAPFLQKVAA